MRLVWSAEFWIGIELSKTKYVNKSGIVDARHDSDTIRTVDRGPWSESGSEYLAASVQYWRTIRYEGIKRGIEFK